MLKNEDYKEIIKNIPSDIKMRLEQIAMFLSQGKASVMIGAGFSKNAQQMGFMQMKGWGELTEISTVDGSATPSSEWDTKYSHYVTLFV